MDEQPCADVGGICSDRPSAEHQTAAAAALLDRLRKAENTAQTNYRQWQECQRKLAAAEARLALLGSRKARIRAKLKALKTRLAPPGSLGERLLAPLSRIVRGATEQKTPSVDATRTDQTKEKATGTDSLAAADATPVAAADKYFSPLGWTLPPAAECESLELGLIIFSANHRAGSTLLQRICNARKGTLIWGEHGGLLLHFTDIYLSAAAFCSVGAKEREAYFSAGEDPNLWIANMCPELSRAQLAVVESVRALFAAFYGQHRATHDLIGFKEVAYGRGELELLRACYPQARFLLLIRNPLDTWRSTPRDWYSSLDYWIESWNSRVRDFRAFAARDARSHLIRYEDLIRREPAVEAVLAEAAQVSGEMYADVLSHKIGSTRRATQPEAVEQKIREQCREAMEALGYW